MKWIGWFIDEFAKTLGSVIGYFAAFALIMIAINWLTGGGLADFIRENKEFSWIFLGAWLGSYAGRR